MAEYKFVKGSNTSKLHREILASNFAAKLQDITSKGSDLTIITKLDLSPEEQTDLSGIISGHTIKDDEAENFENANRSIRFAIEVFSELSVYFSSRGLSEDQLEQVSDRFAKFQQLLYGGFFSAAKTHLTKISTDALVPPQVISQLNKKLAEQSSRNLKVLLNG